MRVNKTERTKINISIKEGTKIRLNKNFILTIKKKEETE